MVTFAGLTYSPKKAIIEYNTVTNSGYMGINFSGDSAIVRYNYVDTYGLNKADGGGIYYGNNDLFSNLTIDHNIVFNGVTNNEADGLPSGLIIRALRNIFIDYGSKNGIKVTNNTSANNDENGIFLHGSQNVVVENNTVYNCGRGVAFQQYSESNNGVIRNITFRNNIIVAKTIHQHCLSARVQQTI
jgi:parallel beta-helix repeat protein